MSEELQELMTLAQANYHPGREAHILQWMQAAEPAAASFFTKADAEDIAGMLVDAGFTDVQVLTVQ